MTQRDDLDLMLSAWLDDPYTPPAPEYLGQVLERTRRTRQRPAWASLERWLPMADKILARPTSRPMRIARLLLVALLVLALAAAVAVVGARLLKPKVEIPQGGAAVLVFASIVGDSGDIYTVRADGTDARQLTNGPGAKSVSGLLAGRQAHRLPRMAGRKRPDRRHGCRRREPDGPGHEPGSTASYCTRGGLAWSPDGSSLIFRVSSACDSRFDLFIVPADGSAAATKLLAPGIDSAHAAWSPDGTKIAVVGGDPAGGIGVYVVDVGPGGALSGGLTPRRIAPDRRRLGELGIARLVTRRDEAGVRLRGGRRRRHRGRWFGIARARRSGGTTRDGHRTGGASRSTARSTRRSTSTIVPAPLASGSSIQTGRMSGASMIWATVATPHRCGPRTGHGSRAR